MQQIFRKVVMIIAIIGYQQICTMPFDTEKAAFKRTFIQEQGKMKISTCADLEAIYGQANDVGINNRSSVRSIVEDLAVEKHEQMKKAKNSINSIDEEEAAKAMIYAVKVYHLMLRCSAR
jgi:DNA-binding MurR/RpiR family transcriptional regulator